MPFTPGRGDDSSGKAGCYDVGPDLDKPQLATFDTCRGTARRSLWRNLADKMNRQRLGWRPDQALVEYSADAGQTWQMLAFNLADAGLTVKTAGLPGLDSGQGSRAGERRLEHNRSGIGSASGASKGPAVPIISLREGALLVPGQPINLSGLAADREDGC